MEMILDITTDEELRDALSKVDLLPNLKIKDRVFCAIPDEDYEGEIKKEIRGKGEKMKDKYKSFASANGKKHVLMGEYDDDYGTLKSGSRNLQNNPVTKEEFGPWLERYGVEAFSLDFPREEVDI